MHSSKSSSTKTTKRKKKLSVSPLCVWRKGVRLCISWGASNDSMIAHFSRSIASFLAFCIRTLIVTIASVFVFVLFAAVLRCMFKFFSNTIRSVLFALLYVSSSSFSSTFSHSFSSSSSSFFSLFSVVCLFIFHYACITSTSCSQVHWTLNNAQNIKSFKVKDFIFKELHVYNNDDCYHLLHYVLTHTHIVLIVFRWKKGKERKTERNRIRK